MPPLKVARRLVLVSLALPLLEGCAALLPDVGNRTTTPDAAALLDASAAAHGGAALATMSDISVSYAGAWHALVERLQPALVDAGFRGGSQERLLLRAGIVAQAHAGPRGRKQVVRRTVAGRPGEVSVWFNGKATDDEERRAAAALVVDGYSLFLLGPMLLSQHWASERSLVMEVGLPERLRLDEREYECDVLRVRMAPGLGFATADRLALFIDRDERLMRRVRFTLDGLESTRGAIAQVDLFDHVTAFGVRWPTRFHEDLLRPLPLAVHDWRLTGLDVNRGLDLGDIGGAQFDERAALPAGSA